MHLQVANWLVECDPEATRTAYSILPPGPDCTCDECRNFQAAAGRTFAPELYALFALLGIDPTKPAELCHWYREPTGLYYIGGWFHFVGHVLAGADAMQNPDGTGIINYQSLSEGSEVALTEHISLLPESFRGLAVVQLEFHTRVPWVLAGAEPAP
ncbi:MAG TPA: hypothetical protein VEY50_04810 [Lysobacter sp.]|nr:hypothetical protein [Lysobacter sp.]